MEAQRESRGITLLFL